MYRAILSKAVNSGGISQLNILKKTNLKEIVQVIPISQTRNYCIDSESDSKNASSSDPKNEGTKRGGVASFNQASCSTVNNSQTSAGSEQKNETKPVRSKYGKSNCVEQNYNQQQHGAGCKKPQKYSQQQSCYPNHSHGCQAPPNYNYGYCPPPPPPPPPRYDQNFSKYPSYGQGYPVKAPGQGHPGYAPAEGRYANVNVACPVHGPKYQPDPKHVQPPPPQGNGCSVDPQNYWPGQQYYDHEHGPAGYPTYEHAYHGDGNAGFKPKTPPKKQTKKSQKKSKDLSECYHEHVYRCPD